MSTDIDNNLFIISSVSRLYQHLIRGVLSYKELGERLIGGIKAARTFRRVEQVRELSRLLVNYPIKEYRIIGRYYLLWCDGRESKYDIKALERIIEQTTTYKTEAMLSLAAFEGHQGRIDSSLYYYTEAMKTSPSASDYIVLVRSIAALKSAEGFHQSALRDLEGLLPILKHAEPLTYYDFLNSYAVELGEAGRKQEAQNISRLVLASPFAFAYPEWHETANEVRGSQRSFAGISSSQGIPHNVLFMPITGHGKSVARLYESARVLDLQKWKKKMGKSKKRNGNKPNDELNAQEMLMRIMQFYISNNTTDEQRRKIYEYAVKVLSAPDKSHTAKPGGREMEDTEGA